MIKKLKNTTIIDIELIETGIIVPASGEYLLEVTEYLLWASDDAIAEITPYVNSGDIVVNDGTNDLTAAEGIRYLEYADRAYIQKDDVDVTKVNTVLNFEGDNVTVTDEGNGKTTISISDDTSDTLYYARCHTNANCTVTLDLVPLVDHTLCLISTEEC